MTYTFTECPDDDSYECYQCGNETGNGCDGGLCYSCEEENLYEFDDFLDVEE